ncbi:MAG: Maf family protein [Candidatus Sumerlaeaceae bacterium]|nr:Maf family protein [Candidatus Sumerlaeaceae bacterium]
MTETDPLPLILASASPRRRELVAALGMSCEFASADIEEDKIPYKTPRELAIKTAYAKACEVEKRYGRGLVIAADTIVVLDGKVYMKPTDAADACRMLGELSGRAHTVISGVAVKEVGKGTLLDAVETVVHIRAMEAPEIAEYVATGEPLDKAGAYAVQGLGREIVSRIDGDYFNVVGLPLTRLFEMMEDFTDVSEWRERIKDLESFN